ncbi:MAG: type IV secretion system DNA-binding domain-containing protein [Minisyncoccia bacterium]
MDPNAITYFAETDARNKKVKFGIKAKDRLKHVYVIGKTGMGKSTLLENMAIQDIQSGNGIAFLDPHGGTAEKLLDYVPESRLKDVIYFAPFDMDYPVSFNIMEDVGADKRHLVVAGLMATFEKIWADAWSARMAYILQNTLLALLEFPGATLLGVNRMYTDKNFRQQVVDNIKDVAVRSFWVDEYTKYTDRYTQEATPAIQNKIGQFASNPLIRNIIGQSKSTFDLREVMDSKKILIVNLSKGLVGEGNAKLLGSMLITKIYLAAMSRADVSARDMEKTPNFYFYVDEFQSFANKSFADILSEARKYKLNLTIAHQYIEQMEEEVRDAVFGNVGTMITFRVGAFDAEVLEKEFSPVFTAEDLVNLGFTQIYLKLMIDGVSSKPFSARAMAPIQKNLVSYKSTVISSSRDQFTRKRGDVEQEIVEWHGAQVQNQPKEPPREYRENRERDRSREYRREKEPVEEAVKKEIFNEVIKSERPIKQEERPMIPQQSNANVVEQKVDENKAAFFKAAEELRLKEKMQDEIKRAKETTISLNQIKKDNESRNPTRENVSNLKSALSSILAKSQGGQVRKEEPKNELVSKPVFTPPPQVSSPPPPPLPPPPPPLPPQANNNVKPAQVIPESQKNIEHNHPRPAPPHITNQNHPQLNQQHERPAHKVLPNTSHSVSHANRDYKREEKRVDKGELYDASPKNEIPEDVLKKLLSVD